MDYSFLGTPDILDFLISWGIRVRPNAFTFVGVLLVILEGAVLAAMLRIPRKSAATKYLLGFFACALCNNLATFLGNGTQVGNEDVFGMAEDAFILAGAVSFAQFAYRYPQYDQPREARGVLMVFASMALLAFGYLGYFAYVTRFRPNRELTPYSGYFFLMPIVIVCGVVVLLRRTLHYANLPDIRPRWGRRRLRHLAAALWRPPTPVCRALRNFALVVALGTPQAIGSLGFVIGIPQVLLIGLGSIIPIAAIALAYYNHAPEPTSFSAKLVGISLVTLLTMMGVNGVITIETLYESQDQRIAQEAALVRTTMLTKPEKEVLLPKVAYIVSWPADSGQTTGRDHVHFLQNELPRADLDQMLQVGSRCDNSNNSWRDRCFSTPPAFSGMVRRNGWPVGDDAGYYGYQFGAAGRVYEIGLFLAPINRLIEKEVLKQILLTLGGSVFVLLIFPRFFQVHLFRPLQTLLTGVQQVNAGNLDMVLPVKYADEIGGLTNAFNRMAGSLRELNQYHAELHLALQASYAESECRVIERTQDLQQEIRERTHAEQTLQRYQEHLQELVEERTAKLQAEIFERKRAEAQITASLQEKEVLLKEIHHRVKNNLQVISSLLNLQATFLEDRATQALFKESQARVRSMALIHERLYQSADLTQINFGEYVLTLVHELYHAYGASPAQIRLQVDIGAMRFGIDTAIPCGLIINELISNALKYAFPEGGGALTISLSESTVRRYELIICDDGIGLPADFEIGRQRSLGLQLVKGLVEEQLDGELEVISQNGKGTRWQIRF